MHEPRENLTLVQEALQEVLGAHSAPEYFERDLPLELAVGPFGQIDDTHPAMTEGSYHAIRPDARSLNRVTRKQGGHGPDESAGHVVERARCSVRAKEGSDLLLELRILRARRVKIRFDGGPFVQQGRLENFLNPMPPLWYHCGASFIVRPFKTLESLREVIVRRLDLG